MKIVVLCGGVSPEREVSLSSGSSVAKGLRDAGFDVELVDIESISDFVTAWPSYTADGVFVALHGGWGEGGMLQAVLDQWKIPYTGTGARGSVLAMQKDVARDIFACHGVPTPPGFTVRKRDTVDFAECLAKWGKLVIKPVAEGSTLGVTITSDPNEALDGLHEARRFDDRTVIEKFIPGSELTVVVYDSGDFDEKPISLPAIEIRPHTGFYDYGSKYTAGCTDYICPAPLDDAVAKRLGEIAIAAHEALGCSVYSRVDFRFDPSEGCDGIYVLEVNTAPGMTATSLVPKAAAAYGWSFPGLLRRLVTASFGA